LLELARVVAGSFHGFIAAPRFGSDPSFLGLRAASVEKITVCFFFSCVFVVCPGVKSYHFGSRDWEFCPCFSAGILSQVLFSCVSSLLFVPVSPRKVISLLFNSQCPHPWCVNSQDIAVPLLMRFGFYVCRSRAWGVPVLHTLAAGSPPSQPPLHRKHLLLIPCGSRYLS
jgi:hypothetical protein